MKTWIFLALWTCAGAARAVAAAPEAPAAELLGGFGRNLPALAAPIRDADRRAHVAGHLEAVELLVEKVRGGAPAAREAEVAQILEIVRHLNQLHGLFADKTLPEERETAVRVDGLLADASAALAAAAGIRLVAVAEVESPAPGARFSVEAAVSSPGVLPLSRVSVTPPFLSAEKDPPPAAEARPLSPEGRAAWSFPASIPPDGPVRHPRVRFLLEVDDLPRISVVIEREVAFRRPQDSPGAGTR